MTATNAYDIFLAAFAVNGRPPIDTRGRRFAADWRHITGHEADAAQIACRFSLRD